MSEHRPEDWARVRATFEELAELGAGARAARLAELERRSPDEARTVAELLDADRSDASLAVDEALAAGAADVLAERGRGGPPEDLAGLVLGPWRLVEPLGRGGMADVWGAVRHDGQFEQRVAVKLLRRGMDSEEILGRFERERRILGRLEHPAIARILDGGRAPDGRPYLVLERVDGVPITEWCATRNAGVAERVRLLVAVADAVAAAHRQLVVHRDLKPSNLLVTDAGEVKLLDFGIAKLLAAEEADERATRTELRVLTPAYAAPEQRSGEPVTTATDVHALGLLAWELLVGRLPERGPDGGEALPRPSAALLAGGPGEARRARQVRGDLDTLVMRALRREPARRYASVEAFAEDLRRYLDGRPILARPDSFGYRARKFVGRHRLAVSAAALVLASLLGGLAAALWQADRAARSAAAARAQAARAEQTQRFLIELFEGSDPDQSGGEAVSARQLLDRGTERLEHELGDQPATRAALLDAVSQIERRLGRAALAERLARRALADRRAADGADPGADARARVTLAEALFARGELAAAGRALALALPALAEVHGPASDELARAHEALALVELHLGRGAAASAHAASALAQRRETRGAGHPETARSLRLAGLALEAEGRYAESESVHRESVESLARALGSDHPRTASARLSWAEVLAHLGEYERAEREFRAALGALERRLGPSHPEVGQGLIKMGLMLINQRRFAAADEAYERALAVFEPLDHYETGTCLRLLGLSLFQQERYAEAVPKLRAAVERLEAKLGADDQLTLTATGNLGAALLRTGELEPARAALARAVDGLGELLGSDRDELRFPLVALGEVERRSGDPEAALVHHRRVLAIAERTVGPEHVGAATAHYQIALDLAARATPAARAEARAALDRAVAILGARDAEHPRLAEMLLESGRLAASSGDAARARRDAGEAAARFERIGGAGDPRARAARRLAETGTDAGGS